MATRAFAPRSDQIMEARRFVRRVLEARGIRLRLAEVELLASELVTNAVQYGRGPIEVTVDASDRRVRVDVAHASADHSTPTW